MKTPITKQRNAQLATDSAALSFLAITKKADVINNIMNPTKKGAEGFFLIYLTTLFLKSLFFSELILISSLFIEASH